MEAKEEDGNSYKVMQFVRFMSISSAVSWLRTFSLSQNNSQTFVRLLYIIAITISYTSFFISPSHIYTYTMLPHQMSLPNPFLNAYDQKKKKQKQLRKILHPSHRPLNIKPLLRRPLRLDLPLAQPPLHLLHAHQLLDLHNHSRKLRLRGVEHGLHAAAQAQRLEHAAGALGEADGGSVEGDAEEGHCVGFWCFYCVSERFGCLDGEERSSQMFGCRCRMISKNDAPQQVRCRPVRTNSPKHKCPIRRPQHSSSLATMQLLQSCPPPCFSLEE